MSLFIAIILNCAFVILNPRFDRLILPKVINGSVSEFAQYKLCAFDAWFHKPASAVTLQESRHFAFDEIERRASGIEQRIQLLLDKLRVNQILLADAGCAECLK